ncbi:MAG: hypothetical protein FADNKDHG_00546 [Holosporales bacterium]
MLFRSIFYLMCIINLNAGFFRDPPPHTLEMLQLELRPFPPREEQIVKIYLVDDETWEKNLKTAQERFDKIQTAIKETGRKKKFVKDLWDLSLDYDYGPANKLLISIFFGDFEMTKNYKWAKFFCGPDRPDSVFLMQNWHRFNYLAQADLYITAVKNTALNLNLKNEQKDDTPIENETTEMTTLLQKKSSKDEQQSLVSRFFSWVTQAPSTSPKIKTY